MNLRPPRAEDEPFLRQLRGQIDSERLFMNYWRGENVEAEKKQLVDFQFRARTAHQNAIKAMAETKENIIEMDGSPVGLFIVSGGRSELRLVEISLLPEWRGKGIGKIIITTTMQECTRTGRLLHLCVEKTNAVALGLYRSLGFYAIDDSMAHLVMEWSPKGPSSGKLYSFASA
ncbi:MAG: GNAT family N-acetyltransferase [Opitutales bacterium]|nr:GNAT family N-acetyltransferase [Opitutales bacterium]